MNKIFLEGSSQDEFMAKLCQKMREILVEAIGNPKSPDDELLSRKETSILLDVTLPTLHNWTKRKLLKPYYKGRRVYYKKSELMASLTSIN